MDAAFRFGVGLAGGITFSSMGTLLVFVGMVDIAIPAALAGWIVGLIAYRRTRHVDLLCSKGLGIGTLAGQLLFIASAPPLGVSAIPPLQ